MKTFMFIFLWALFLNVVGCAVVWHLIPKPPDLIPTRMDIQQALVDAGYPIQVDGIIGPDTIRAWECEEEDTFSERLKR